MDKIQKHIEFIKKDLIERGEIPTSKKVRILGALYFLTVKKEGEKRGKSVTYSAAKNVLSIYRAIPT